MQTFEGIRSHINKLLTESVPLQIMRMKEQAFQGVLIIRIIITVLNRSTQ